MKTDACMCPLLSKISMNLSNKTSLQQLLSMLENSMVCPSHPDEQFIEMAKAKKKANSFHARDGKTVARLDDYSAVTLNSDVYHAGDCSIL